VVVAKETVGNLGGMVRQLSLDQFENESRRMVPMNNDASNPAKKFTRQRSPQGLHKKVRLDKFMSIDDSSKCYFMFVVILQIISTLLRPRNWKAPANRRFFLDSYEVGELCYAAEQIFMQEPTVLQLRAPIKVFGDLHGQFGDLMRLFDEYGFPSAAGDIT
jgi:protein phosphatase